MGERLGPGIMSVAGARVVAVPEHARSVLPSVSLAPQFIANARAVKTPGIRKSLYQT